MRAGRRRLASAAAAFALLGTLGAGRASPPKYRAMIFSGDQLARRIALDDSTDVDQLLSAVREPMTDRTRDLSYRPYLNVALFVAIPTSSTMPLAKVPLGQADAHARFYPAYGDEAPFWVFADDANEASPIRYVLQTGLDLLQRHGVPIRMRPGG
jgi:hypothetical protein